MCRIDSEIGQRANILQVSKNDQQFRRNANYARWNTEIVSSGCN